MAGPRWALFLGVTGVATLALLGMAYATQRAAGLRSDADAPAADPAGPLGATSTGLLLANVAVSHGLLGSVLVGAAWLAELPPGALGIAVPSARTLLLGAGIGVALYLANEAALALTERSGIEHDERLRAALTPGTLRGWAVLLLAVLPVIAGVEELLFRAALIGGVTAASDLPVWAAAVGSSVLFGLGHGLQGPVGIAVAGLLGFALAVAFVLTGSLAAVVVAHYCVNALEFLVHADRVAPG